MRPDDCNQTNLSKVIAECITEPVDLFVAFKSLDECGSIGEWTLFAGWCTKNFTTNVSVDAASFVFAAS